MAECSSLARFFLVGLNVVFVILGLTLAISAALFMFGSDLMKEEANKVLEEIPTEILGDQNLQNLINSLGIAFLVLGIIVLVIGLLGCLGACCKFQALLVTYAIIVSLILILQVVAVVFFMKLKPEFDHYLNKGLTELFDTYSTDAEHDSSRALDGLFHLAGCCGYHNASDITDHSAWNQANRNFQIPQGCCKSYNLGTKDTTSADMIDCLETKSNSFATGCKTILEDLFNQFSDILIYVGIAILVVELLCVIFAFVMCCNIQREKEFGS